MGSSSSRASPESEPTSSDLSTLWKGARSVLDRVKPVTDTFKSEERTRELLRPELENNTITSNDYDKAVTFLPKFRASRLRNDLLDTAAITLTGLAAAVSLTNRSRSLSGLLFASAGSVFLYSMYKEAILVRDFGLFMQSLENPSGLGRALLHIRGIRDRPSLVTHSERHQDNWPDNVDTSHDAEWVMSSEQTTPTKSSRPTAQAPADKKPSSKWEEIRAVNTRATAKSSSWDAIRQGHERAQLPESSNQWHGTSDRTVEQAKFDAMIEEERRRSSGS